MFFFEDTAQTEIYTYRHTLSRNDARTVTSARRADQKSASGALPGSPRSRCDKPLPAIAEACVFENPASRRKSSNSDREGTLPSCKLAFTHVTSDRRFAGIFTTETYQSSRF